MSMSLGCSWSVCPQVWSAENFTAPNDKIYWDSGGKNQLLTALLLCEPPFIQGVLAMQLPEVQVQVISLTPEGRSALIAFHNGWKEADEDVDDQDAWFPVSVEKLEYAKTADGLINGIRVKDFDYYWHSRGRRQNHCT